MPTLYEIDSAVMACVDEETGEILDEERLDTLLMERNRKLEGVALWIKNLESDAAAIKAERNGSDTCKSPLGLFETMYIPNDLKAVDEAIRGYYSFTDGEKCSECGNTIISASGKTVEEIVEGSQRTYGKKMCWECVMKKFKEQKANAETVPD